jgi:YbbR domain-containing protein
LSSVDFGLPSAAGGEGAPVIRPFKWIRDLLFQNLVWKLLSLAIAVVIWALVATEPELATFANVRLEYKNLPAGLEISSEPVSSVVLELRGPSGALRGMGDAIHPAVVIDMSDASSGEHTFSIGDRDVKVVRGVRLVRAIPSEVRFHFEPRRMNTVPVHVRFLGEGQNGYALAEYHVDPPEMEITGPRSRVARIAAVVADPIDLSGTTGTSQFHVNTFTEDSFVRFLNAPEVVVTVTMKKK